MSDIAEDIRGWATRALGSNDNGGAGKPNAAAQYVFNGAVTINIQMASDREIKKQDDGFKKTSSDSVFATSYTTAPADVCRDGSKKKKFPQFVTNRENTSSLIIDPECGSNVFLMNALYHAAARRLHPLAEVDHFTPRALIAGLLPSPGLRHADS